MLTVNLPFPSADLFPNRKSGTFWAKTIDSKNSAFSSAYTLTHQAVNQHRGEWYSLTGCIPLTITFCPPDKRHRDLDNCLSALKSALDGVATALTVNDKQFSPITLKRGDVAKHGCVLVQVGGIG